MSEPKMSPPTTAQDTDNPETTQEYVKASDVNALIEKRLAERDAAHEKEMTKARAAIPQLQVGANAGGPGVDNHRPSWSKAEQEAAQAGEDFDYWHDD
jgi:hypothetical protein